MELITSLSLFSSLPLVRSIECITSLRGENKGQEEQKEQDEPKGVQPNQIIKIVKERKEEDNSLNTGGVGINPRPRPRPWEPGIETGDPPPGDWGDCWGDEYTTCVSSLGGYYE